MSDLINRQQAINIAKELTITTEGYEMYNQAVMNYCAEIMQLPSIQPEQPWIPVTEILPENDNKVLITHSHGVSMAWWNGRYWTGSMIKKYKTVTARMPLPESYQKGGK